MNRHSAIVDGYDAPTAKDGQYLVHVYVVVEAPGIEAKHFGLMHSGRIDLLPNEPVASLNAAFNRRLFPITKAIADEQPI